MTLSALCYFLSFSLLSFPLFSFCSFYTSFFLLFLFVHFFCSLLSSLLYATPVLTIDLLIFFLPPLPHFFSFIFIYFFIIIFLDLYFVCIALLLISYYHLFCILFLLFDTLVHVLLCLPFDWIWGISCPLFQFQHI